MSNGEARIPPRLNALPSELLLEIFTHLVPKPSTRTPATSDEREKHDNYRINISLRNVKAVCRRFAALVTPLITAHYCDGDFYHVRINSQRMKNWEAVKSVIMDGAPYERNLYRHFDEMFHKYIRLRDVDAQLGLSDVWGRRSGDEDEDETASPLDQEEWKEELEEEEGVNLMDCAQSNYERATVLCLCPNVEEILFGSYFDDEFRKWTVDEDWIAISPIVSAAKGEAFGRAHRFEHLRYLSMDVQFIQVKYFVSVLRLPSLQHLVLEWRDWTTRGFDETEATKALENWGCPDRSSNVQTLELRNVKCPASIVGRLIKSCKELRSFSINCEFTSQEPQQDWYREVFDQLKGHDRTLEKLMVTTSTTPTPRGHAVLGATDLQQFEKLKHLQIPFHLIAGYGSKIYFTTHSASDFTQPDFCTLFPPSIRMIELDIYSGTPYNETTAAFFTLLEQEHELPDLGSVHVTNHTILGNEDEPELLHSLSLDFYSLSALARGGSKIDFGYTLLHDRLEDTDDIEWARTEMLREPHGEELIKHATCGQERRWNELLSRPVGTPLPFGGLKKVLHSDAETRGWLRDDLSVKELAEKVREYELKSLYSSLNYKSSSACIEGA
ncbi:hypothetical protein SLS60_010747 [Paraconiothyrium brasiliense]|uniref:F-box domain-containing protein n=1 Tax=Paraconiothyrium brasiliense TaxID=300254 RepID=A0ABR3QLV6_9PLEO